MLQVVCIKQVADSETRVKVAADGRSLDPSGVTWIVNPYEEGGVIVVTASVEGLVRLFELDDSVPAPTATARALVTELSTGTLADEIGATVASFAQGLAIAVAVGVVSGVLIGSFRVLLDDSFVLIEFLRPIPAVALIPLAVLFFGFGAPMRRWIVAGSLTNPAVSRSRRRSPMMGSAASRCFASPSHSLTG